MKHLKYRAFISYKHDKEDERFARNLHRKLERYRVPRGIESEELGAELRLSWFDQLFYRTLKFCRLPKKNFVGENFKVQRKLGRVFRDEDEMSLGPSLDDELSGALKQSKNLIVICSPKAATSEWVNEEIIEFKKIGRHEQILPIVIDGEVDKKPCKKSDEIDRQNIKIEIDDEINKLRSYDKEYCFPPGLIFSVNEEGELIDEKIEPNALRINNPKSRFPISRFELNKIVAKLIGVDFEDLWHGEKKRIRARRIAGSVVTGCMALLLSAVYIQVAINQSHRLSIQNSARIAEAAEQALA